MPNYKLTFKIYRGDELVRTETLEQDVVKIGKLSTSHVRLDDETVSRMHAVIEVSGDDIHVIDLGSTRGTQLNGEKVSKAKVSDGDEINLGDTRIVLGVERLEAEQPAAAPTPAPSPGAAAPPAPVAPPRPGVVPPVVSPTAAAPPPPRPLTPAPVAFSASDVAGATAADAELDDPSAARAIEVAAMFHDTVVEVAHLTDPARGKVSTFTYAKLALAAALVVGGLVLSIVGQVGVAAFTLVGGVAVGVLALIRLDSERVPPHYYIGADPQANFHIESTSVPSQLFPLVHSSGTDFALRFTDGMEGDVTLPAGERVSLKDLAKRPETRQAEGAHEWPLADGARCKLDLGDNTFLVNSVHRSRAIGLHFAKTHDWNDQLWNGVSAGAHLLVLFLMFSIPPGAKILSLDLFGTDNRFVKFLIKPPEQKEEEIPDWLKKQDDPGGKGQKHKDEEGKMGDKKSKKKDMYAIKGKTPDQQLARKMAEEAAKNAGVLGLLKQQQGSQIASIFGKDSALGADAQDALGNLLGDQIGEGYGVGGLGMAGTGRGGGGTGAGTIGLGTLGTIGRGGGGGSGQGYGRGAGRLGGRRARAPNVVPGQAVIRGSLDKEIIRRVIRRHINEVKYCYERELMANPDLSGRVAVQFTISGTGQVIASVVQSSTMKNPTVEQCIAQAVRRWLFPKPEGGGIVIVTYPFLLKAAGE